MIDFDKAEKINCSKVNFELQEMNKELIDLEQKIKLNQEIISNLKEFFGTYLSNFLKEYRDKTIHNEKLNKILQRQDSIYQKFNELMKQY